MASILDQYRLSLMARWDVGTLGWVVWDGSLTTGSLTIGTVDQGTGGSSAWLTKSGFGISGYDYLQVTYTDSTKATISTVAFKSGGASGTVLATLTLSQDSTHDTWTKT